MTPQAKWRFAVSDAEENTDDTPPKKGRLGLIIVVLLALLAGGGAFGAVWLGALDSIIGTGTEVADADTDETSSDETSQNIIDDTRLSAAFYPLEPIAVSIDAGGVDRQLRVRIVLDVPASELDAVTQIGPRLQNGMLSYLRAVNHETLENPAALFHLRAQMLRRAKLIAGEDAITNLLVTDFVLN